MVLYCMVFLSVLSHRWMEAPKSVGSRSYATTWGIWPFPVGPSGGSSLSLLKDTGSPWLVSCMFSAPWGLLRREPPQLPQLRSHVPDVATHYHKPQVYLKMTLLIISTCLLFPMQFLFGFVLLCFSLGRLVQSPTWNYVGRFR